MQWLQPQYPVQYRLVLYGVSGSDGQMEIRPVQSCVAFDLNGSSNSPEESQSAQGFQARKQIENNNRNPTVNPVPLKDGVFLSPRLHLSIFFQHHFP